MPDNSNLLQNTLSQHLRGPAKTWAITGAAGFIGSNLTEALLKAGQKVVGIDNFSTGSKQNLTSVQNLCSPEQWRQFTFIKGDICDLATCQELLRGVDFVLHNAALGSVVRSIETPIDTHQANVSGFLNMLESARKNQVAAFVYASSSSVYGSSVDLPKSENKIGEPLSPYAASKLINEVYAQAFCHSYGFSTTGLRYFNVFGRRQSPDGAYAAVIPKWIGRLLQGLEIEIYGDGETSRDFCYVDNVVLANVLAAINPSAQPMSRVYNVACSQRTTLIDLYKMLSQLLIELKPGIKAPQLKHNPPRTGDIKHSLADITKAQSDIGYQPLFDLASGLRDCLPWYLSTLSK